MVFKWAWGFGSIHGGVTGRQRVLYVCKRQFHIAPDAARAWIINPFCLV